jgi:hypothetical protein
LAVVAVAVMSFLGRLVPTAVSAILDYRHAYFGRCPRAVTLEYEAHDAHRRGRRNGRQPALDVDDLECGDEVTHVAPA